MFSIDAKISPEWNLYQADNQSVANCINCVELLREEKIYTPSFNDIVVSKETAIQLVTSEEDCPCELYFALEAGYNVEYLAIITNSPTIELFAGQIAEYVETASGDLIDDVEGDNYFEYHFNVGKKISNIMLKFVKHSSLVILGIAALIRKAPVELSPLSINIDRVQEMLAETTLSEKAKQCQENIKNFMNANPRSGAFNKEAIMQIVKDSLKECITQELPEIIEDSGGEQSDNSSVGNSVQLMKSYIDAQSKTIEDNIVKRVDERLLEMEERQNEKLDAILKMLTK